MGMAWLERIKSNIGLILFSLFIVLFGTLMVVVEVSNGRFWTNDWLVYVEAANDFFSGNSPYGKAYGLSSGFFKYPPPTLYFFWISTKLTYFTSQLVHVVVQLCALIFILLHIRKIILVPAGYKHPGWLYLLFLFIAVQVVRELHMGNINLELLALLLLGSFLHEIKSWFKASFIALFILFKPIFLPVLLPFTYPFSKSFLFKISSIGIGIILFALVFNPLSVSIDYWSSWIEAILFHGDYIINQTSLAYLTKVYLGVDSEWWPPVIALLILTSILFVLHKKTKIQLNDLLYVYFASIPTLFKLDTQAFIFSLPLIACVLISLKERSSWIIYVLFVLLMVAFSLNSTDLWGKVLMNKFNYWGMLGLANIALIILFICLRSTAPAYEKVEK
jgi:hypothetical protein